MISQQMELGEQVYKAHIPAQKNSTPGWLRLEIRHFQLLFSLC